MCLLLVRHAPSSRAFEHLRKLSAKYPRTKFVSIIGDKCIPNYPDRNLPTFFHYRKGQLINQHIAWGAGRATTLEGMKLEVINALCNL